MQRRRRVIVQRPEVFGITTEWRTSDQITDHPRALKMQVRHYNDRFGEDEEHQYYIISGSYGYKLTQDKEEIMHSIEKEERLAKIRFKQAKTRRKNAEDFFTKNTRLPL